METFELKVLSILIGSFVGYISFLINITEISFIFSMIVLGVFIYLFDRKFNKNNKWWFYNCIIYYVFMWIAIWAIFYNTKIIGA